MKYIKKYFIVLVLIILSTLSVHAQTTDRQKIIIYYLNDESPTQNYRYYSYIIPDSLAAELKNHPEYEVLVLPVTFKYISSDIPSEERTNIVSILTSRGKEVAAGFSIIGSYKVEKNTIHIKTQICNIASGEIYDAAEIKEKVAALIYEIIEKITVTINKQLQKTIEAEKEKIAVSPYKNFFNSLHNYILGYTYTIIFFTGDWESLYNDTTMGKIFLGIPLNKLYASESRFINNLYIIPSFQLFSTDNRDIANNSFDTNLTVYMGGMAVYYFYTLSSLFSISVSIETGISYSELFIALASEAGPFPPHITKTSYDPYISASVNSLFYFYSIGILGGIQYNRILYNGNDLEAFGISFGVQYRL